MKTPFLLQITLSPSFHRTGVIFISPGQFILQVTPILWDLEGLDEVVSLTDRQLKKLEEIRTFNRKAEQDRWDEKTILKSAAMVDVNAVLEGASDLILNPEIDDRILLDGIGAEVEYMDAKGELNTFKIRSPNAEMRSFGFIEQVIELCEMQLEADASINYLEVIKSYFDIGVPWRVTSSDPLVLRVSSRLSIDHKEALEKEIRMLPLRDAIVIDMRNFEVMGGVLYSSFAALFQRFDNVRWVIKDENEWARGQVLELGAPEHTISSEL